MGKASAKPVGQMSNPDAIGPIIVDRETLERLLGKGRIGNVEQSSAI